MDIADLLRDQDGVVSRAQLLARGEAAHDLRRLLRRRQLATVVDGVYVDHTGGWTWEQRAMAGVLHAASGLDVDHRPVGAALAGHSALRQEIGPGWRREQGRPITVAVDVRRSVRPVRGYRFVRLARLEERVDQLRTPPRLRLAEAVVELIVQADDVLEVVGVVGDARQSRAVTVGEIQVALERRPRVPGRALLTAVLTDVSEGTCSALEHLFLSRIVDPHGLPAPTRQGVRVLADEGGRREFRDAEWAGLGLVVELDGRLFHDSPRQRDRDLDRDLDDAAAGHCAVRLGWGQVTRRACRSARRLDQILRRGGWSGAMRACPEC